VPSEVKIKVTVEDDTAGLKSAKAGLADVEKAAGKAGTSLSGAARDSDKLKTAMHDTETASDKAGNALGRTSDRSKRLQQDMASLEGQIKMGKAALGLFASALADTDDAAQRIDIKKAMSRVQSDISASTKAHKVKLSEFLDLKPDPSAASGFIKSLGGSLTSAASALGGSVGPVLGGAIAAAAAPTLASTLGGLLSAGAGMAVIGGGIALAVKNSPGIQQAGQDAGIKFMNALGKGAKAYTGPINQSLGIVADAGQRVAARLTTAFSATANDVVPLVRNIVQGVEGLIDAVAGIAENSGPALEGFGDMFRLVMDGLGDGLTAMTQNSQDFAGSMVLIGGAIGDAIRYTGEFLGMLDKLSSNSWITGPLLPLLKAHYQETADASNTMAGSTQAVTAAMSTAEKAANGERDALVGLSNELKAQTDPVFGLLNAQQDLKKAQKDTADATKKHGKNSEEAREALRRQATAALALESNVGKLGGAFNGKLSPALRNTLKAAGLTDGAINGLERQFGQARKAGDSFSKTYQAQAKVNGASTAIASLYSVRDAANAIPRAVSIAMRITGVTNVSQAAAAVRKQYAHGGIKGAASGGFNRDLTWVGEQGPELITLPPGTMVHSSADSRKIVNDSRGARDAREVLPSTSSDPRRNRWNPSYSGKKPRSYGGGGGGGDDGGWGGGELVLTWEPTGNAFLDALSKDLRVYIRNNGGNVQEVLGQKGR
jgi:hypothetical protein